MKLKTPFILLSTACLSYSASIVQNNTLDNQRWFSDQGNAADLGLGPYGTIAANSAVTSQSDNNSIQNFDERTLTFTDLGGSVVDELFIVTDLIPSGGGTPIYDDAFAVDLDGNNTIDYFFSQNDAIATPGIDSFANYAPWTDASPLVFEISITATGSTVNALWNGTPIQFLGAAPTGFNNVSSITLEDLGFDPGGVVPSNNFTTGGIRIGSINSVGGSASGSTDFNIDGIRLTDDMGTVTFFDPDGDGIPASIPEPTTGALIGLSILCLLKFRARR